METIAKKCVKCGTPLTKENYKEYRRKNYMYICNECIKKESRKAEKRYYENNKNKCVLRSNKCHKKLRRENPVLYKCREMYSSARKRAIKKEWDFNLTPDFVYSIAVEKCPFLNVKIDYNSTGKNKYAPSLDRIDSSKGYTKDNVQIISNLANCMKSNATKKELITFSKNVLKIYDEKTKGVQDKH